MREQKSYFANMDWGLFFIYLLLTIIGLVNVNSTSNYSGNEGFFSLSNGSGMQLVWVGLSFVIGFFILLLESTFIQKTSYFLYGISLFMLVAVLFMPAINGQKSWFGFGPVGIQPSEIAKTATALAVARYLTTINVKMDDFRTKLGVFAIIAIPAFLIILQPDPGTLLVFMAFTFVLYREGLSGNILMFTLFAIVLSVLTLFAEHSGLSAPVFPSAITGFKAIIFYLFLLGLIAFFMVRTFTRKRFRKYYLTRVIVGFLVASVFVGAVNFGYDRILKDHHRTRIELFLGLQEDPDGEDYNRNRAMAAVGSGGFYGKGFRQATLASPTHGHVPEQETDFAFCTWSEEFGFLGSTAVIILFVIFLIRIINIAERQRSVFTRIYAYSVACILFIHFLINVGMIIGIAPVVGIPLPFISKGGSSFLAFSILIFVLIKLDSDRKEVLR